MRIAFIVAEFPSLSETFVLNQITDLIDAGHEVDIFPLRIGDSDKVHPDIIKYNLHNNINHCHMPSNKFNRVINAIKLITKNFHKNPKAIISSFNFLKYGKSVLNLSLFYRLISFVNNEDNNYDVIHCHFGPNGVLGVKLRELGVVKGKITTVFHGYDITKYLKINGNEVYNNLFEKGDLFLPISERWKNKLIELGCPKNKIIVHHMGIDTKKFDFKTRHKSKKIKILTIARLVEKKGVEYGVRAVADLLNKYSKIEYKIAGDGPLKNKIGSIINELDLASNIKLLGWKQQDEIAKLIKEADILLAPSVTSANGNQEGIPVAIMEAMARGMIVISTYHSGIPELVKDGKTGFLVPEKDVSALSKKLSYVIEHGELWGEMSKKAREFVNEHFNICKLNKELINIFKNLIK